MKTLEQHMQDHLGALTMQLIFLRAENDRLTEELRKATTTVEVEAK